MSAGMISRKQEKSVEKTGRTILKMSVMITGMIAGLVMAMAVPQWLSSEVRPPQPRQPGLI